MKCLPLLALGLALSIPVPALAQDKPPQTMSTAELRAKIQTDKKALVEKALPLTPAEAAKFWPLYDKFQKDLAGPQSEINKAIIDYVSSEATMTDANAKRLVDQILRAEAAENKLRASQFQATLKVLPAKKAARYFQIENKIRALIRYETAATLPFVQ